MPTYEYECDACGHAFEKFQSITAPSIRKCPRCGKIKVRRLIGIGAGIIFKGSGFYQTDYRSESYKQAAQKDKSASAPAAKPSPDASKGDSKGESKDDSKGESKGESKSTSSASKPSSRNKD